jgi:hypothetical protein
MSFIQCLDNQCKNWGSGSNTDDFRYLLVSWCRTNHLTTGHRLQDIPGDSSSTANHRSNKDCDTGSASISGKTEPKKN